MIERHGRYAELSKGLDHDPEYRAEVLKLGFAEQVWKLMEQQNLSRAELARRLGTSRAYVTKVLQTTANLTLASMAKIALALHAQVSLELRPQVTVSPAATPARPRHPARLAGRNQFVASDKPARHARRT
jgi:transcriptional regulator with XRE-family HTH domain